MAKGTVSKVKSSYVSFDIVGRHANGLPVYGIRSPKSRFTDADLVKAIAAAAIGWHVKPDLSARKSK